MQGEKLQNRVTIQDISREVDMSIATVSAVLGNKSHCYASEKTKTMIREKAREMGYRPNLLARSLKNGRTHIIGLICSSIQNEISSNEVVYLTNGLLEYGYTTQIIYYRGEERLRKQAFETLADHGCDAIVISGHLYDKEQDMISMLPMPVFHISTIKKDLLPGRTIYMNYEAGVRRALEELCRLGHRSFFFIGESWNRIQNDSRYRVFCNFCVENEISDPINRMLLMNHFNDLDMTQIKNMLMQYPDLTAFVATNDICAMKIIQVLHAMGQDVPHDFSIIGFDDITAAQLYIPSLSSIRQPVAEVAEETIKLIMNELEGKQLNVRREINCQFQKRQSIGKARSHHIKFK